MEQSSEQLQYFFDKDAIPIFYVMTNSQHFPTSERESTIPKYRDSRALVIEFSINYYLLSQIGEQCCFSGPLK